MAISMVQPLSTLRGLLIVPLTGRPFRGRDFPVILRLAAIPIRLPQPQVPSRVECVHLQLGVIVVVAVRVEKDLEVVVFVEN